MYIFLYKLPLDISTLGIIVGNRAKRPFPQPFIPLDILFEEQQEGKSQVLSGKDS